MLRDYLRQQLSEIFLTQEILEIFSLKESQLQELIHEATEPWGVEIERVELKDVKSSWVADESNGCRSRSSQKYLSKVYCCRGGT